MAETNNLPIRWGSQGFSLNVDIDGKYVSICKGFPPSSVFRQTIYTTFYKVDEKIENATELVSTYRDKFQKTNMFNPAGSELKLSIEKPLSQDQINTLNMLIIELAKNIKAKAIS